MTRRTPPTPIYLLPAHIATPPRGTPKYIPPAIPPLIPLTDSIGPKLRIHAYRRNQSSALTGLEPVVLPEQALSAFGTRGKREDGDGPRPRPPWLSSRGFSEAAEHLAEKVKLAQPTRARVRG